MSWLLLSFHTQPGSSRNLGSPASTELKVSQLGHQWTWPHKEALLRKLYLLRVLTPYPWQLQPSGENCPCCFSLLDTLLNPLCWLFSSSTSFHGLHSHQSHNLYQHGFMRSLVSSSGWREQRLPGEQVTQRPVGRDGREPCLLRVWGLKRSVCPKDAI